LEVCISFQRKNNMIGLIGLDELGSRKDNRKKKKEERKEKKQEKKQAKQEKKQEKKKVQQNKKSAKKDNRAKKKEARGGSRAKKILLAPSRAAFFLLMKINFLQLRTKLREAWVKDKAKVEKGVVNKFGFKRENFLKELNRKESSQLSALGVDPATGTAVAQATPIITQVIAVLKSIGVAAGAIATAKSALSPKDRQLADEYESGVEDNLADIPENERTQGGGQTADDYRENPTIKEMPSDGSSGFKLSTPVIIAAAAAAAAALFYFSRKK
jgi:hypothetical protein